MMKRLLATCFAVLVIQAAACKKPVGPDPVTPQPPVPPDTDMCDDACINLVALNCEESKPIDMKEPCCLGTCRGVPPCPDNQYCDDDTHTCHMTCKSFCQSVQAAGVWLDPKCVSHITSCDQIDSCPNSVAE